MKELPQRKIGENKSKIGSSLNTVGNQIIKHNASTIGKIHWHIIAQPLPNLITYTYSIVI